MRNIKDLLLSKILESYNLSKKAIDGNQLNDNNIILYPIFKKDKIEIEEVLIVGKEAERLSVDINTKLTESEPDFSELVLFIREVEEFLLLEDMEIVEEKLKYFNSHYMSISTHILEMIFELNGDLKILRAKIDFDSFMENYRYKALEYGLYFLSETILATVPEDTKKIYLASTYDLNKMPSYSI